MARFRQANDELRDLVQEEADAAYGAGLRRTVALIVILSAAFAGMAGMLLGRLRRQEHERQAADQSYHSTQREFAEILQVTETEAEAHALVKRHLERTLPGSDVVVLNRNNSQNRLEATTPVNTASAFAQRLVDSAPNSCLAVRLGRPHEQSREREPLLACSLCGLDRRSICVPSLVGGEVIGSVLLTHDARARRRRPQPHLGVREPGGTGARQPPQPRRRRGARGDGRAHRPAERAGAPRDCCCGCWRRPPARS